MGKDARTITDHRRSGCGSIPVPGAREDGLAGVEKENPRDCFGFELRRSHKNLQIEFPLGPGQSVP